MGGAVSSRLGFAAFVLALIANIPLIAASVIFAILTMGTRGSVFEALGELLAVIGPIGPGVLGGLSLLALILGIATNVRMPGQRDVVTAIVIVVAGPVLAFAVLGLAILL